jgi:hypothetical protein
MPTIIYLTDGTLDEQIARKCREHLEKQAGGIPIVSVSQKPLAFGKNVCVGEIGRSWLSLYKQLYAGLTTARTKYIAIAEHDCLYRREHFTFKPPRDDTFYYNRNTWLVQWGGNHPELNGMYSYWPKRYCLSQLVCNRMLFKDWVGKILALLGDNLNKQLMHAEPGICTPEELEIVRKRARDGKASYLHTYLTNFLEKYKKETFKTKVAILDIRHASNFTGPRRGGRRRYSLPYWGRFEI